MPAPKTVKKHGGVSKVRMKRMSNGTLVRVYFYKDHKSFVDATTTKKGKTSGTK
jgi:hypothetical protein